MTSGDTSLRSAADAFLETAKLDRNTYRTYSNGLAAFLAFLQLEKGLSESEIDLLSLDESVLEGFLQFLRDRKYSRFTTRTYMSAISSFFNYLLAHDLFPPEFSLAKARARLRRPRRSEPYPAPVPDPALPLIIQYYDELPLPPGNERSNQLARLRVLRARAIVHTLYSSAGRIAEVASLDRRDVADGRQNEVVVTGKGGKQRFIYLTGECQVAIQDYVSKRQDVYQPLFISHGRDYGSRLSKVSIWKAVKDAADALNINVSPHDFRHFRARQMLNQGAPLEAIQEILGHSDISTTRKVYAIYSRPSVKEIFRRATLPPQAALEELILPSDECHFGDDSEEFSTSGS